MTQATKYTHIVCSVGGLGYPTTHAYADLDIAKEHAMGIIIPAHREALLSWRGPTEDGDGIEMENSSGGMVVLRGHIVA